ncbi:MAG: YdeI/OmpD-associated family protein [Cryomorphaceae bacterium]|jgi:uncharacterized protein YdeI (YjbR/CyaY-like superfamily)|nr:YdeI/OmpD-associated family protein [Cryomorphaceae bacterium]
MNPQVDEFLEKAKKWQAEMKLLREIVLECSLTEEFKWRQPCYSINGKNVLFVSSFKDYGVLAFFKGVLLADQAKILARSGENTQGMRMIRFTNCEQIKALRSEIKQYIFEAVEIEKAGLKVPKTDVASPSYPAELVEVFDKNAEYQEAFEKLTPGRQRAYILHFSSAKHAETRSSRIEKYKARILKGKGIDDCICGLSKRMPSCDGSHKFMNKE